jgi:hypothetical protein
MRVMMKKSNFNRMAIVLLLLSSMLSLVSVAKGDLVGHRGLIAAYKPYIVFPSNNHGYSSNSLTLNVSFKAMAYANMNYSATYSLDNQANEPLPVVKHYLGNWVIYHGENDYVDGSVKLPTLSEGSHTITVFLTLDWEIGDQNGVTVYTYYDNETVNFTIGQDITPEPSAVEPPIIAPPVENKTEPPVVTPSIPKEVEPAQPTDTTPPAPDPLLILVSTLMLAVLSVGAVVNWKKRKR